MVPKFCSIPECGKTVRARGWCNMHYTRWFKHGDPAVNKNIKPHRICSVEECSNSFYCKDLCKKHYGRLQAHGDPLMVTVQEKTKCVIVDCEKMQHAHTYCASHLYHFKAYGDPLAKGPGKHKGRNRMDVPSYAGMHKRLFYDRGKASAYQCVDCASPAQEWSYDGGCSNELFEVLEVEPVAYSTDQGKYSPRCIPCHRMKDLSGNQNRKGSLNTMIARH